MYVNAYEFELKRADDSTVNVALRLDIASQIAMKKKFDESTTDSIFGAIDDVEKFVYIMDRALNYAGNKNEIKKGEELVNLMIENDMLGMARKQLILTSLGVASGIFSADEKEGIDKRVNKQFGAAFGDSKN